MRAQHGDCLAPPRAPAPDPCLCSAPLRTPELLNRKPSIPSTPRSTSEPQRHTHGSCPFPPRHPTHSPAMPSVAQCPVLLAPLRYLAVFGGGGRVFPRCPWKCPSTPSPELPLPPKPTEPAGCRSHLLRAMLTKGVAEAWLPRLPPSPLSLTVLVLGNPGLSHTYLFHHQDLSTLPLSLSWTQLLILSAASSRPFCSSLAAEATRRFPSTRSFRLQSGSFLVLSPNSSRGSTSN